MAHDQDSREPAANDDDRREAPPAPWEWAIAAVGALLVAGTLAFLLVRSFGEGELPPVPQLSVLDVQPQDARYLVRVRVHNRGQRAAANLRVTGVLRDGARVVEEAETEFQYVAGGSTREAGLFFAADPRRLLIELSARSYQEP